MYGRVSTVPQRGAGRGWAGICQAPRAAPRKVHSGERSCCHNTSSQGKPTLLDVRSSIAAAVDSWNGKGLHALVPRGPHSSVFRKEFGSHHRFSERKSLLTSPPLVRVPGQGQFAQGGWPAVGNWPLAQWQ